MVEKALLAALVAIGLIFALDAIATNLHKVADKIECGFDRATVCLLDKDKEL